MLILYIFTILGLIPSLIAVFATPEPSIVEMYGGNVVVTRAVNILYLIVWAPFLILAPLKHSLTPNSPLKKALLTGFHSTAKHNATKAVSPSSETMRTI